MVEKKTKENGETDYTKTQSKTINDDDDDDDVDYDKKLLQNVNTFQLSIHYICYRFSAPINYSRHRTVSTESKYSTEFQGSFGPAAPSAK